MYGSVPPDGKRLDVFYVVRCMCAERNGLSSVGLLGPMQCEENEIMFSIERKSGVVCLIAAGTFKGHGIDRLQVYNIYKCV